MKKLFILGAVLMPVAAVALDMTGCETIGYWQSTDTTCYMYDECVKSITENPEDDHDPEVACRGLPRTADECAAKIAADNMASAETDLLIRCPATDVRLGHKNAPKTSSAGGKFVATDGVTEIKVDDMVADADFVYYTNVKFLLGASDVWRVIGPRDKDGLYMAIAE